MGCCGDREKQEYLREEQRWEYINLDDFKATSCWAAFAYGWLWIMLFVSLSVYAVDTFTCVNLLTTDKWAGQIEPAIPIEIARWIFVGCIILSVVLLIYRWLRAVRVMRQGGVAKSYLDPLAVRVQSTRMGKQGRGWRRFLVFAELTKSRKGADYVALFAYFSFEAWLRIVFAEGPRQVVNGITLFYVMKARLAPEGSHAAAEGQSPVAQFFINIKYLADENLLQAIVLFGMLWTLIIWVISALSLALSVILYLIFLWHHIPSQDGGLTNYCRNKINRRMGRIVKVKVDKALKKENEIRSREEARAQRDGVSVKKQPTLPNITTTGDDKMPPLSRQTTLTTLPEYESRPGSVRSSRETLPPLPGNFADGRPLPRRHGTSASDASWASYNSNAPLMAGAGDMGHMTPDHVQTPASAVSTPFSARPGPSRNMTGFSQFSDQPFTPGPRPATANSMRNGPGSYQMEPIPRTGTAMSAGPRTRRQPSEMSTSSTNRMGQAPLSAHPNESDSSYFPPLAEAGNRPPGVGPLNRAQTFQDPPPRSFTPQGFLNRSMTSSVPPPQSTSAAPFAGPSERSFTPSDPPPQRSFTAYAPGRDGTQTPVRGPSDRSFTPSGPPPRTFTPYAPPGQRPRAPSGAIPDRSQNGSVAPSERSFTPGSQPPPLTRIQTSNSMASTGYTAFNPRSATPASETPTVTMPSRPNPPAQYRSFSRPLGSGQRNSTDVNRDSGFDDILSHY